MGGSAAVSGEDCERPWPGRLRLGWTEHPSLERALGHLDGQSDRQSAFEELTGEPTSRDLAISILLWYVLP